MFVFHLERGKEEGWAQHAPFLYEYNLPHAHPFCIWKLVTWPHLTAREARKSQLDSRVSKYEIYC